MKKIYSMLLCLMALTLTHTQSQAQESKMKINNATSYYYEPNELGIVGPNRHGEIIKTKFKFSYAKTESGKYIVMLDEPVPKSDLYTTQIFLNTLTTIYKDSLPKGRMIDLIDYVPLNYPKNQTPKPCCKQVLRVKLRYNIYFISNIAAQDDSNKTVAAFVVWKE